MANGPYLSSSLVLPLPSSWNSSLRCTRSGPGHAGHASGLHLARQQFVLHHVGERRVDRAAHIRGGHHEPQAPAGPRVDLDAVARDRAAGRPEPLRELARMVVWDHFPAEVLGAMAQRRR